MSVFLEWMVICYSIFEYDKWQAYSYKRFTFTRSDGFSPIIWYTDKGNELMPITPYPFRADSTHVVYT